MELYCSCNACEKATVVNLDVGYFCLLSAPYKIWRVFHLPDLQMVHAALAVSCAGIKEHHVCQTAFDVLELSFLCLKLTPVSLNIFAEQLSLP